jgi:hypothetical protein
MSDSKPGLSRWVLVMGLGIGLGAFLLSMTALAAPPAEPEVASGSEVVLESPVEASMEVPMELPLDLPEEVGSASVCAPTPAAETGQPCCVSLCEQICGVGEACACKRCQVFGCGL